MAAREKDTAGDLSIITTHMNADFDALASMLAAQKLYPQAQVVFPGSQEKNLKNFFISSMVYLFNMVDINKIDLARVSQLVLVDTRQASRIGKLAAVLENPGIDIHIYDHHPLSDNDIRGSLEVHDSTGANVTILAEMIRKEGIAVSPDEATVMCLGIYEDTGSFTYPSTTGRDFKAAAYLLSKGANLNIISDLIARELSPQQVVLLNDMIQSAHRHNINGVEVVLTSVTRNHYMPDFAFLVQKMVRMENLDAIFAMALMENKIYLAARSRIEEVDVGQIVSRMGGGGHSYAAAATIKGKTLVQSENQLLDILYRHVKARRLARDLMSSPALSVDSKVSCREAHDILTRYSINALLVTEKTDGREQLRGYITRMVIEKALFHKLAEAAVADYMSTELGTVDPGADLPEIQEKIIDNKQRILPVIDGERIAGVITRTDLLNVLVRRSRQGNGPAQDVSSPEFQARTRNVKRFMSERLSADLVNTLQEIGRVADDLGYGAYVVGGFVRDLFLYRRDEDIDIVIEGDGIAFARKFAKIANARVHSHAKFGTAVIIYEDGFKIDVASARMEYYKFPAALPVVEMSSIKLDLFRRDFTINTLAIQLNPEKFGTLIDFFSAMKDLKEKTIRLLHNLSLVEDPTRVFRALRFEQRFGFSIGKLTAGLIENAISMDFFKELSGRRVFTELRLIMEEENPVPTIIRLNDYDLLKVIHPAIKLDKLLIRKLNAAKEVISWFDLLFLGESYMRWAVYFLVLISHGTKVRADEVCDRFELPPKLRKMITAERRRAERTISGIGRRRIEPAAVYRRLDGFKTELILYMMAVSKQRAAKKAISLYFTSLRHVTIALTGKDLIRLGLAPGPIFKKVLRAVLDQKLNGKLKTFEDELTYARNYVDRRQSH
jgi:tRNA nucleotidyltransferase (CCA-adding enzyme)